MSYGLWAWLVLTAWLVLGSRSSLHKETACSGASGSTSKEILTPSWREVGPAVVNGNDSAAFIQCSEEEVSGTCTISSQQCCYTGTQTQFLSDGKEYTKTCSAT